VESGKVQVWCRYVAGADMLEVQVRQCCGDDGIIGGGRRGGGGGGGGDLVYAREEVVDSNSKAGKVVVARDANGHNVW